MENEEIVKSLAQYGEKIKVANHRIDEFGKTTRTDSKTYTVSPRIGLCQLRIW